MTPAQADTLRAAIRAIVSRLPNDMGISDHHKALFAIDVIGALNAAGLVIASRRARKPRKAA